jgi:hypothetical protein
VDVSDVRHHWRIPSHEAAPRRRGAEATMAKAARFNLSKLRS